MRSFTDPFCTFSTKMSSAIFPETYGAFEFCGLEFEPACVEFYKTKRSVRTVSSEQVRQPIFLEAFPNGETASFGWVH